MDIETFKLEEWLKKRENKTRFNLAENWLVVNILIPR